MATTNKSLTTYLPVDGVEWLENYCLGYKHLLNKEGKPKLGTALADIISRLAEGELVLPQNTESSSTVIDDEKYGTELSLLKGEVEELRNIIEQYSTNNVPSTVLDDSWKGEVEELKNIIERYSTNNVPSTVLDDSWRGDVEKMINTSIGLAIEPIAQTITELETHTRERFDELEAHSIATVNPNIDKDPTTKTWVEFFKMVGVDALTATEAQKKDNIDIRTKQIEDGLRASIERGLGEWTVRVAGRSFVRVGN